MILNHHVTLLIQILSSWGMIRTTKCFTRLRRVNLTSKLSDNFVKAITMPGNPKPSAPKNFPVRMLLHRRLGPSQGENFEPQPENQFTIYAQSQWNFSLWVCHDAFVLIPLQRKLRKFSVPFQSSESWCCRASWANWELETSCWGFDFTTTHTKLPGVLLKQSIEIPKAPKHGAILSTVTFIDWEPARDQRTFKPISHCIRLCPFYCRISRIGG